MGTFEIQTMTWPCLRPYPHLIDIYRLSIVALPQITVFNAVGGVSRIILVLVRVDIEHRIALSICGSSCVS